MAIEIIRDINVDFYDKKYTLVNAKQYDDKSRCVSITCYNQGNIFNLSANRHTAYVRYRKSDGHNVFNVCRINYKGEVEVDLTEQMLASIGICYVDLIIVNKGSAVVDIDTGKITTVDNSQILSTMAFCVDVHESTVDNSLIESSDEFDGLNDLLTRAEADYSEVVQLARSYAIGDANNARENEDKDNSKYYSRMARSYAIGDADGVRKNENTDNAKYYSEQASLSLDSAKESEANAKAHMEAANEYMNTTNSYMNTTKGYMDTTNEYMGTTETYMNNASVSASKAATSEQNTNTYMNNAKSSEDNAKESETKANNYYTWTEQVVESAGGVFMPMGTITYSELATIKESDTLIAGHLYNISDSFTSDETFKDGAGIEYVAGTNVFYTTDGFWCTLAGTTMIADVATVDEVVEYLGIGEVN